MLGMKGTNLRRRGATGTSSRLLVAHASWVWLLVLAVTLAGILAAIHFDLDDLQAALSQSELRLWLLDQYAYVLLWLVVMQAVVAASASGLRRPWRTGFRWFVAAFCALSGEGWAIEALGVDSSTADTRTRCFKVMSAATARVGTPRQVRYGSNTLHGVTSRLVTVALLGSGGAFRLSFRYRAR